MDEQIVAQLEQISDLLRRRLELEERRQEEAVLSRREALEQFKEITMPSFEMPAAMDHDSVLNKIEERNETDSKERRAFQAALLAEIKRHNDLLERLLESR